jgi:hypothetical protein
MPPTTTADHMNRISALIDKAESTSYPAEAEALLAKAQELMARHAIDEAMLTAGRSEPDEIVDQMLTVRAPYASAKSSLLGSVAKANRCRTVYYRGPSGTKRCVIVGHRTDVEHAITLFHALSLQAVRFMLDAPVPEYETPRRFRHAFLLAFAARIGGRLWEANRDAEADTAAPGGGPDPSETVAVVLAKREEQVDRHFKELFPRVRYRSTTSSSGAGFASGAAAADRASLGNRGLPSPLRALPGGASPSSSSRSQAALRPVR